MTKLGLNLLIAGIFVVPQLCIAQWVPVTATESTTRIVTDPGGKQIQDTSSTGSYYRSDSGSEITVTQQSNPDGSFASKTAKLIDNDGLAIFTLDYNKKIAYRTGTLNQHRAFTNHSGSYPNALGHEQIAGLDCVILPILENGKMIGKAWKSPKNDLILKMDYTVDFSGYKTHITKELRDVSVNASIPSDMFQVPANFKEADATPKDIAKR